MQNSARHPKKTFRIAIAGAGNVGRFIARDLVARGHEAVLIERDNAIVLRERERLACEWVKGDACEPLDLRRAKLQECEVMVAATGDDEDNLVISLLGKQEFGIPRMLARVNHPNNAWLFTDSWGVDISVSAPQLLCSLVEEAVTVGDLVQLFKLEQGKAVVVEFTLPDGSSAAGRTVGEMDLPRDSALVAVLRDGHVIMPRAETPLLAGDELLVCATPEAGPKLKTLFGADD